MKKAFEIILIIVGIILGSVARINTTLTPQRVIVSTKNKFICIWNAHKIIGKDVMAYWDDEIEERII